MGRKSQQYPYSRRWACIIIKDDPNVKMPNYYPLDQKGKLRFPFKTRKHDRTADHKAYLPDSSSDISFSSSHFSPPPPEKVELEGVSQISSFNSSGSNTQKSDEQPDIFSLDDEFPDISSPSSPESQENESFFPTDDIDFFQLFNF